ncbi:MAG: rhodanese-like domain-containing protein [Coxiellaceae bacterium]|nr:rhodanese-like domain-containing protein [Coxiellaceae bacterium]
MRFVNISAYKFVTLSPEYTIDLRFKFKQKADELFLKGTILLSNEGVNMFLSGTPDNMDTMKAFVTSFAEFEDLWFRDSYSDHQPFNRMLVRLKKEIISMGCDEIQPEKQTAPHLEPEQFKQWYDDGKDMLVLDTRNDYEIRLGTFEDAVDLDIDHFRKFPEAIKNLPEAFKKKPIVTFCTGGVRCEKAADLMQRAGFEEVYQLNGGIINYFEKCGGDHYDGDCFVFDKRVALNAKLEETDNVQCYSCREPLTMEQLDTCGGECPYCHQRGGLPNVDSNIADTL